jgi:hypothetical protein
MNPWIWMDIKGLIETQNSCNAKVEMLESIINYGQDILLPLKSKLNVSNDPLGSLNH